MNIPENIDIGELSVCISLLHEIFGDAKTIFAWLDYPHPELGHKRPRDAIIEGETSKVMKVLKNMIDIEPS